MEVAPSFAESRAENVMKVQESRAENVIKVRKSRA